MQSAHVARALIVGINHYEDPRNNLKGCVNDALTIAKVATEHAGFPRDEVRLVCDERATTANIRERLQWLVSGAGPGSQLLFHYSGHGSQVRDRDGDELDDHLDEILCPYDLNWEDPFTDDELGRVIAQVGPDVRFTIVLDCCHSGTATREFFKERAAAGAPNLRYLTPPPDVAWRAAGGVNVDATVTERTINMVAKRSAVRRFGTRLTAQNVLLIAGCRAEQTSADAFIDNDYHGALTYGLWKALETAQFRLSNAELVKQAGEWLTKNRFAQVPQLEGPRELFDGAFLGLDGKAPSGSTVSVPATAIAAEAGEAAGAPLGAPAAGALAATSLAAAHVVFVHGIGDHKPGYSAAWKGAFGPSLQVPDENYHEVVWDGVFDRSRQPGSRGLVAGPELSLKEKTDAAEFEMQMRELLAAREEVLTTASGVGPSPARALGGGAFVRDYRDRGLFNWLVHFDEYIGDFAKYLAAKSVRDRVDATLQVVLEDLFSRGVPVLLITHSWGTVVGHHTLRRLQGHGEVSMHCTLGSPLWMFPVRQALRFDRPRAAARTWVNVDAAGDLVGGRLGTLYDVTAEALNVAAPGSSPHGSYFVPGNLRVQRDIVAAYAADAVATAAL